jgi:cytochrome o ubiquinol oxidase subunit II
MMSKKLKLASFFLLSLGVVCLTVGYLRAHSIAVLNPQGLIASKERGLIITLTLLMLIVVIPVFGLTFAIAWRYREGNTAAKYTPEWDRDVRVEAIWWAVPLVLIAVISMISWSSSHELDPFKSLTSRNPPITIQVVALQWKWLFIYPAQNIATVNFVQFPANTPVNFQITADAPMNSFWIPQLGGQIYAMPGMSTQLHLMADGVGSYRGVSANLSGQGFAGMKFTAKSSSAADFASWVRLVRQSHNKLTSAEYDKLVQPSQDNPTASFSSKPANLYDTIITKYMSTTQSKTDTAIPAVSHG